MDIVDRFRGFEHEPNCKHPSVPVDVCGCQSEQAKQLADLVESLQRQNDKYRAAFKKISETENITDIREAYIECLRIAKQALYRGSE